MKTERRAKNNLYAIQGERKKHTIKKMDKQIILSHPRLQSDEDLDVFVVRWVAQKYSV